MDAKQIADGLLADLGEVAPENRLGFLKRKVSTITDPAERSLAEAFIILGYQAANPVASTQHIVVLVHGIRTQGVWQDKLYAALQKQPNTIPVIVGFGYFDLFSFWLPKLLRAGPIDRVEREVRGVIKDYPGARVSVVAHSFGTYIISQILTNRPDIQLHRLLLCGAIVDRLFAWDALRSFPTGGVVNEVGTRDKLPAIAKMVSWGYGSSGTFGFRTHKVKDRFFDFAHSDFFSDNHIDQYWIPYLVQGTIIESSWSHERPTPAWWVSMLEILPLKTLVAVGALYGIVASTRSIMGW